jgi:hypothetical protein
VACASELKNASVVYESQVFSMVGPSIAGVLLHDFWIGTMLELASALQLANAALYWTFFRNRPPPEEQPVNAPASGG